MARRVLIAGCGDVGTRAAELLVAEGNDVFGMRRRWPAQPDGFSGLAGDLTNASSLAVLPNDFDQLVYCPTPAQRSEAAYQAIYVDGLRNLLAHLDLVKLQRVLFVSSTAVYGQNDGCWIDEDSPTAPTRFNGRILLEAERVAQDSGTQSIALRLAGIYGPGRDFLLNKVRAGASCRQLAYSNRIHAVDAARAIAHLLQIPSPSDCYIGVDEAPVERCEVMRWLAARMGAPAPTVEASDRPSNKRCRNVELLGTGFAFRYSTYEQGYLSLIDDSATASRDD